MKRKILSVFAFVLIVSACSKDTKVECPPVPETLIAIPPTLFFNIVDKETGQYLFLSTNPKYDTSQLNYSIKTYDANGNKQLTRIRLSIDSSRMCFQTSVTDSAFIQIANLSSDTLRFLSAKSIPNGPCNYLYYVDSAKFDNIDYAADNNQIITLKK